MPNKKIDYRSQTESITEQKKTYIARSLSKNTLKNTGAVLIPGET